MTKQQVYIGVLFAGCCLAVPAWGQQPILELKETKYKTTYDYIINNFKGAVEYVHGGPSFRSGGIVVGYYLYKYHHQPIHSSKEQRKRIAAASKDASILEQPNTRPGEANFMVEGGMHLSSPSKWTLHGNFYVMDKFVDVPIGFRWTIPIKLLGYNIFSSTSVGCMVQYLTNSIYDIYETPKRNLKQSGQEPPPPINLKKKLNDMPSFYYSLLVEWGLIFPLGIYTSFIFYLPLDSFYLGSKLVYEPQEDKKLTSEYVQSQRSVQRKMFAWSVGVDFYRLLNYFKSND